MEIKTRTQYGLEITIKSDNTTIVEDVSTPVYDKEKKSQLGLPLRIGYKIDASFKRDIQSLLEDIYYMENIPLYELMVEWYNNFSGAEKDEFLEKIGVKESEPE